MHLIYFTWSNNLKPINSHSQQRRNIFLKTISPLANEATVSCTACQPVERCWPHTDRQRLLSCQEGFCLFPLSCAEQRLEKVLLSLDADETGMVQWWSDFPKLICFWFGSLSGVHNYFRLRDIQGFTKDNNCVVLQENKAFLQLCKQAYDFFLSWIFSRQVSVSFVLLIPASICTQRHQIPLHTDLSEIIRSSFLLQLQVLVEFLVVLDETVGWAQQEGSRSLVYLKVRIVFVLTILTTYLPSRPTALRGT